MTQNAIIGGKKEERVAFFTIAEVIEQLQQVQFGEVTAIKKNGRIVALRITQTYQK